MMKRLVLAAILGLGIAAAGIAPAGAAPVKSHSPNVEVAFPVVCNGVPYTLVDAPASVDHADFTAAFVTGSHQVVIPFAFNATGTGVVLTNGAVFDGVTYNAGDTLFSETQVSSIGARRPGGQTCTFSGSEIETFTDDIGQLVQVQSTFSGTAQALFPNSR